MAATDEEAGTQPEEDVVEASQVSRATPKAKGKAKAKAKARGRKIVRFEKSSWVEVSARPDAQTLVARLLLTADSFGSH